MTTNPYLHALRRFWYIVALGFVAGTIAGVLTLYRIAVILPPKLELRSKPSYVASTDLLVDSPSGPYLRTRERLVVPKVVGSASSQGTESGSEPVAVPETKSLVEAANLFPLFVESDAVAAVRARLVGNVAGFVTAKALFSSQGVNRFRPSTIPVMRISGVGPRPRNALLLAQGTARAFKIWLRSQQKRANIPPSERIVLRQLNTPTTTRTLGSSGYGLPALLALAVLVGFAGLAFVIDSVSGEGRARPALGTVEAPPSHDSPAVASEAGDVRAVSSRGPPG